MKVALYLRESSDDPSKAPPIATQQEAGEAWAKEEGHEITKIYADDGYSGGNWNRPDWQQSVKDAKRHQYQVLWTWNQDRIARDTEQFLWFMRTLRSAKVRVFEGTSHEYIDMDTLGGRVKHQSLAQAAEIFRLVTSEKVKRKYKEKQKKANGGHFWGRAEIGGLDIELIQKLRAEGKGYREIAKEIPAYTFQRKRDGKTVTRQASYQTIRRMLQKSEGKED